MALPQEHEPPAFARFWVMHIERRWDVGYLASRDPRFTGRCFPIGVADIATFTDSPDVYLGTLWGGRWGLGGRLTLAPDGAIEQGQILWIS